VDALTAHRAARPTPAESEAEAEHERLALLRLSGIEGVGRRRMRAAVEAVGSAQALLALEAPLRTAALAVRAAEPAPEGGARAVLARCRTLGVRVLGWGEALYPPRLRHLADPPPLLYVLGDVRCLHRRQVAVVGSRRATGYGRRTARALARGLAHEGVVVLSGMALGVDGEAHRGALEAGGQSNAVLASGPERASPRQHERLYRALLREGAVASEHPPATPSLAHHFPVRNRLMAALAHAVVVVEATRKSGALITAREGAELGREILAVPGPIDAATSYGTNQLLADGARPALDVGSVLTELEWAMDEAVEPPTGPSPNLGADVGQVWSALEDAPRPVDEVARGAGLSTARALAALTRLEVEGWAAPAPGLRFARQGAQRGPARERVLPEPEKGR
jgi:DNA processing protein